LIFFLWIIFSVLWFSIPVQHAKALSPLTGFQVLDAPNDNGGRLLCIWDTPGEIPKDGMYRIFISDSLDGPFFLIGEQKSDDGFQAGAPDLFGFKNSLVRDYIGQFYIVDKFTGPQGDGLIENDIKYFLRLELHEGLNSTRSAVIPGTAVENFFNWAKLNNLVIASAFSVLILGYIGIARRKALYIRRIGGLEALDEALGRATEMGKPVLFIHGLRDMSQISTIAAVNILGRIAGKTALYDTSLRVVAPDPVVMSVSQETVQASYFEAGRPDSFNPDHIFVAGTEQFSYAAATEGIMVRDRPAAHIMMGYFYAESLLLAETGATTGAIQIAGTDAFTQLPFFVTTCDYTLLGEELYAASAYLSREPKLLGSLKGQDVGKAIIIAVLIIGSFLSTFEIMILKQLFSSY
tara:strand:+ start:25 stop:1245 length:1221 start_codon:yes stop_codon:yes gene_type:complete